MASFPPNVYDGELWLPAGAFPEEMYRPNGRPAAKLETELACELTSSMEELAQRLALAILDETHHHPPEPIPLLSSFPQANPQRSNQRYPPFGPPCLQINGYAHKPIQPSLPKPVPGTTQLLLKPSLNQLLVSRTRNQGRGLPFRVVGSGASGFIRESGGTGVFLPRVVHADACMRRKPNAKPVEEQPLRNAGVGRVYGHGGVNDISIQSSRRHRLSSEMALPSEWTY